MPTFRKKPVTVEAFRYLIDDQPEWFLKLTEAGRVITFQTWVRIGDNLARHGDWIIKAGSEFYSCRPDVFDAMYEPAGNSPDDQTLARVSRIALMHANPASNPGAHLLAIRILAEINPSGPHAQALEPLGS